MRRRAPDRVGDVIDLAGRSALVTGGARGLGRAIAKMLAMAGAQVHVTDLPEALDATPRAAGELSGGRADLALDLTAPGAESRLKRFLADLRGLDILVANAGTVPPWRRVAALDLAEWDRVMAVNLRATAMVLKVAAPWLSASPAGAALLMASINGYRAHPDQTLYTASKHAVVGLMRAAALDMGRDGVRVNALAPGPVLTEALHARLRTRAAAGGPAPDAALAALAAETALGRIATETDVARAALFLVSDLASGVTGHCLPVEAGLA